MCVNGWGSSSQAEISRSICRHCSLLSVRRGINTRRKRGRPKRRKRGRLKRPLECTAIVKKPFNNNDLNIKCMIACAMKALYRVKPGVHTNDFAPIHGRRAKKLGHASLATVFRHGRFIFQPILLENLESPLLRYQPITAAVITEACLNTRWHHGA